MKLDKRIIKGKKPLSCLETEEAKQFIGKEGYFTDCLVAFTDISRNKTSVLTAIDEKAQSCFIDDSGRVKWDCFLPKEWVNEPEKKYRPFSIEDWKFKHSIGETILYRYKDDNYEAEVMYLGYIKPLDRITDEAGEGQIVLGNNAYSLQNLFDNYEIWVDGGWKPFGFEVEE